MGMGNEEQECRYCNTSGVLTNVMITFVQALSLFLSLSLSSQIGGSTDYREQQANKNDPCDYVPSEYLPVDYWPTSKLHTMTPCEQRGGCTCEACIGRT